METTIPQLLKRHVTEVITLPVTTTPGTHIVKANFAGWDKITGYYFQKVSTGGLPNEKVLIGLQTRSGIIQETTPLNHYLVGENVGISYRFVQNEFNLQGDNLDVIVKITAPLTSDLELYIIAECSK
jgi:hypothetical protein